MVYITQDQKLKTLVVLMRINLVMCLFWSVILHGGDGLKCFGRKSVTMIKKQTTKLLANNDNEMVMKIS